MRRQLMIGAAILAMGGGAFGVWAWQTHNDAKAAISEPEISSQEKRGNRFYQCKDNEWATLTVEPVEQSLFRAEHVTEGKVAVDEDRSTQIFSPYSGRVTKLLAKPGDTITPGQPLFVVEAADTVSSQNDFITASTAMNKAKSALNLAQIIEKRNRDLYEGKAVALKDFQQAQADLVTAQNDARSAETALEAARNRLRILGRTDQEITTFQESGRINADTPIFSPIGGTVVQRKIGPGQYVATGASDPVFVVGDLSTIWLTAYVRETDASKVSLGQDISFTVLAYPDRVYKGKLNYVSASMDATSRRLMVRATINNPNGLLKPEMFANVTIFTDAEAAAPAVPRDSLIYEGSSVRLWIAHDDKTIELRQIKTGRVDGRMVEVIDGVHSGEQVVTKGSLFIDRIATAS